MEDKLEYSAADMASAAAGGWRDGQRAAAEAAQSAPAGEREAFVDATSTIDPSEVRRLDGFREGWEAYASWQRTQAAGVPEGWRSSLEDAALMLEAHSPGSGSVESYAAQDIRAMLAAAPAQPEKVAHSAQWPTTPWLSAAPAQPAVQDLGEVRRLREALQITRDTIDAQLEIIASRAHGDYLDKLPVVRSLKAHRARCDAALAASTGQEV